MKTREVYAYVDTYVDVDVDCCDHCHGDPGTCIVAATAGPPEEFRILLIVVDDVLNGRASIRDLRDARDAAVSKHVPDVRALTALAIS